MSRRSFVLAAGAPLGVSVVGSAREPARAGTRQLDIAVTAPYRAAVAELVQSSASPDTDVSIERRSAGADPHRRLRDGNIDVYVAGEPPESGEDVPERAVTTAVVDWGVLAHAEQEWRECLCRREVRDRWTDDQPVATWSETDWDSIDALARRRDSDPNAGERWAQRSRDGGAPDWTALVRGTRSYQYANGHGGLGYYPVERDEIRPTTDGHRQDRYTPLVQLGYVQVDGTTHAQPPEEVLDIFDEHAPATASVTYFGNPH